MEDELKRALQIQASEINLLRKLIYSAFDETGTFCGVNRHEKKKLAEIVKELGNKNDGLQED